MCQLSQQLNQTLNKFNWQHRSLFRIKCSPRQRHKRKRHVKKHTHTHPHFNVNKCCYHLSTRGKLPAVKVDMETKYNIYPQKARGTQDTRPPHSHTMFNLFYQQKNLHIHALVSATLHTGWCLVTRCLVSGWSQDRIGGSNSLYAMTNTIYLLFYEWDITAIRAYMKALSEEMNSTTAEQENINPVGHCAVNRPEVKECTGCATRCEWKMDWRWKGALHSSNGRTQPNCNVPITPLLSGLWAHSKQNALFCKALMPRPPPAPLLHKASFAPN